jgi:hypothetical protein
MFAGRRARCRDNELQRLSRREDRRNAIAWKYGKALPSLPQIINEHVDPDIFGKAADPFEDYGGGSSRYSFEEDEMFHYELDEHPGTASCFGERDIWWDEDFLDEWHDHIADTSMQYST